MKVLSIHDGHNASAAVFNENKVLAAVSEERLSREKFYWGFPHQSIKQTLQDAHLSIKDIDAIAVSHLSTWGYVKRKFFLKGGYTKSLKHLIGDIINVGQVLKRELTIRLFGLRHGIFRCVFCDHHLAHAYSAYYFSGFSDALVITMDGLGDSVSHTAHSIKNGEWKEITKGYTNASPGLFYGAVTEALGFKSNRHEGKIVGLAAVGDPEHVYSEISACFKLTEDKRSFERKGHFIIIEIVKELISNGISREDIAAATQKCLEDVVVKHIETLLVDYPHEYIACAGGVFANVKLNQRILEIPSIKDVFIQPAMGDDGLVLGAPFVLIKSQSMQMEQVYLGNDIFEKDVVRRVHEKGYVPHILTNSARETAEMVAQGKIVGWCDGRMEFGPRALGHRSIIADPRNKNVNDLLNKRLKRSDFMPFAPSMLYEKRHDICEIEKKEAGVHAGEFMTITYNIKKEWAYRVPAVVHVDGTARPQFVRKEINKNYHSVLEEFYSITGVPLFMNTSFNVHEEPIVATPEDAFRTLESGAVDVIVFNNKICIKKQK